MTQFPIRLSVAVATIFVSGFFIYPASAASLEEQCRGNSEKAVRSCCAKYIEENGRPLWMFFGGPSCEEVKISCTGKSKNRVCEIDRKEDQDDGGWKPGGGDGGKDPSGGGQRGGTNPTRGGQ